MASSVPQSAKLPPPLHSPHSPFNANRPSAFGSSFDDFDGVCARRHAQQSHSGRTDRSEAESTSPQTQQSQLTRWPANTASSSQPSTPCAEAQLLPNGTMSYPRSTAHSNPSTSALGTPTSLGKTKDARLACRQNMEDAYAPALERSGDSGRPQKKELRIEECIANAYAVNRAVFSPASALSTRTMSMDTACTGGRDSSVFSFASSMPDSFVIAMPGKKNSDGPRRPAPPPPSSATAFSTPPLSFSSPPLKSSTGVSPMTTFTVPAPPSSAAVGSHGGEQSSDERSAGNVQATPAGGVPATTATTIITAAVPTGLAMSDSCSSSTNNNSACRMSKCKRRLQGLNRPAFDLKAVEEAQCSFLAEETVCNAAQCFPMSEITALLWVGTWKDAADQATLRRNGIKYVLNVAKELDQVPEASAMAQNNKDLIYESIPMNDCHSQDVALHLRQAFEFIEKARAAKSRVLVHCRRGISRSAAIVVGYLMASEHRSYEEALKYVTERRSCVSLNLAFQERLSEYVPGTEFYHGPPPPSPALAAELPASSSTLLLPSLSVLSNRSDSSSHGSSFRQPAQQPKSKAVESFLPHARGSLSASSSNASSRASSSTVRNAAPPQQQPQSSNSNNNAVTSHNAHMKRRPRLSLPNRDSSSVFSASATTVTGSATTASPTPTTNKNPTLTLNTTEGSHAKWSEEDSAAQAPCRPNSAVARPQASPKQQQQQQPQKPQLKQHSFEKAVTASTLRGAPVTFADLGNRHDVCSCSGGDEDDDEEITEPGSPFGVGNRRAFAQFNFSQPTSSNNASPATKKDAPGFSDDEERDDSSAVEGSQQQQQQNPQHAFSSSFTSANKRGANLGARTFASAAADEEHARRHNDERPHQLRPTRPARHTTAFDDLSDEDDGDDDDGVDRLHDPLATDFAALHKPQFGHPPGRGASAPGKSGYGSGGPSTTAAAGASASATGVPQMRLPLSTNRRQGSSHMPAPHPDSVSSANERGGRSSSGAPTGGETTVGDAAAAKRDGMSTASTTPTPFAAPGAIGLEERALAPVHPVTHTPSLSG